MEGNIRVKTTIQELSYNKLTPRLFENLCLRLFSVEFPYLEEHRLYGVAGMKQYGIDFYAYNSEAEKYIVGQCKNYSTSINIENVIDDFLNEEFSDKTQKFILAVPLSLSKKEKDLIKARERLSNKNIEFILWDAHKLNLLLKKYPQIVFDFFDGGDEPFWVKAFCGEFFIDSLTAKIKFKSYSSPTNYIPRFVKNIPNKISQKHIQLGRKPTIIDVLESDKTRKKIILQSDAGLGKTTELEYIAGYFSSNSKILLPVLKYLKNYTNQSIEELLSKEVNKWKNVDYRDVIILLDGLDELRTGERDSFLRSINQFTIDNEECSVLISCRSNFIDSLPLENFDIWELEEFNIDNITTYTEIVFKDTLIQQDFINKVTSLDILGWLKNPFILNSILKIYLENHREIPKNRKELLEKFTSIYFYNDKLKGNFLAEEEIIVTELLKKLSLCMNLLGVNSLTSKEFTEIFRDKLDRDRIKKSSMINIKYGVKFIHNIFQEFYAASALSEQNFETIREIICFQSNSKIKPKWYNTITILIDLLYKEKEFDELIKLITRYQPSLLFKIEYREISKDLRFNIFEEILNNPERKYNNELFYTSELAFFGGIRENGKTINYLLDLIEKSDEIYLPELFYLLECVNENQFFGYKEKIINVCKAIIEKFPNESSSAINTLCRLNIIDRSLTKYLIENVGNTKNSKDLRSIYNCIYLCDLSNEYIDFLIDGIKIFYIDNQKNDIISGLNNSLISALSRVNMSKSIHKLLDELLLYHKNYPYQNKLDDLYKYNYWYLNDSSEVTSENKCFISILVNNVTACYLQDESLYEKFLSFYCYIDSLDNDKVIKECAIFFQQLNLTQKAFWELLERLKPHSWEKLSYIISKDVISLLVKKYSSGKLNSQKLWTCIQAFNMGDMKLFAESMREKLNKLGKDKFEYEVHINREKINEIKHSKDLELLVNKNKFIEEINNVFKFYNSEVISFEQIISHKKDRENATNNVIYKYLSSFKERKWINLNNVLIRLKNANYWNTLVILEYRNMLSHNKQLNPENIEQIRFWCLNNINSCDFTKAIYSSGNTPNDNTYSTKIIEYNIGYFFQKLNIILPEDKILEMLCFDLGFRHINERNLSEVIIERVDDIKKIKESILFYFNNSDLLDEVRLNFIKISEKHNFTEAKHYVKKILIEPGNFSYHDLKTMLKSYFSLGGELSELEFVLSKIDINNEYHILLLESFADYGGYESKIQDILSAQQLNFITSEVILDKIIQIYINIGSIDGLELMRRRVIEGTFSVDRRIKFSNIEKLNLNSSIDILIEIFDFGLLKNLKSDKSIFSREEYLIFNILSEIALIHEENFEMIRIRMQETLDKYPDNSLHYNFKSKIIELEKEHYLRVVDFKDIKTVLSFLNNL